MSNTNNNLQNQTSNALHNAIMEVGGKDRPPILAHESTLQIQMAKRTTPVSKGSQKLLWKGTWRTLKMFHKSLETNWMLLLKLFYKMMNELVKNKCDVTNHQVNVQFLLQLQPEWQRFMTLVEQSQELKTVSYHKLYDILKQHQNQVNEIRAARLARTANPLINLKPTNNNLRTSSNTSRANQDNTLRINRGTGDDTVDDAKDQGPGSTIYLIMATDFIRGYIYLNQMLADISGPFFVENIKEMLTRIENEDLAKE
ncbi:hypothetical protein Tco_0327011 [Tanacetum coccineum]